MKRQTEQPPSAAEDGFVDRVRTDLDQAEAEGDETRLDTLEKIRGDLEAELDSSLENRSTGY